MSTPPPIHTTRLTLTPASPELAHAELADPAAFAATLGAEVPDTWPPNELSDVRLLFLCLLEANPAWTGWLGWYAVDHGLVDGGPGDDGNAADPEQPAPSSAVLVGSVGFKGPPDIDGAVEIGYSIIPAYEGRGLATEMVDALATWAGAHGARVVHAQVKPSNAPSVRVLEKLAFRLVGPGADAGTVLYVRPTGTVEP